MDIAKNENERSKQEILQLRSEIHKTINENLLLGECFFFFQFQVYNNSSVQKIASSGNTSSSDQRPANDNFNQNLVQSHSLASTRQQLIIENKEETIKKLQGEIQQLKLKKQLKNNPLR